MKKTIIINCLLITIICLLCSYRVPKDWVVAGRNTDYYNIGIDEGSGHSGKNAATIQSKTKKSNGFATLMQSSLPTKYLDKRVRMTGYMRSADVKGMAYFWFRVDQPKKNRKVDDDKDEPVLFGGGGPNESVGIVMSFDYDNNEKPVTGTTGWKKYELYLNIPKSASNIAYGAVLYGAGQIWFDSIEFESVDKVVPAADRKKLEAPANLNFEN